MDVRRLFIRALVEESGKGNKPERSENAMQKGEMQMYDAAFEVSTSVTRESCRAQAGARLAHHVREIVVAVIGLALATAILYAIHSRHAQTVLVVTVVAAGYACLAVPLTGMRLYASRNAAVDSIWLSFQSDDFFISTKVEQTYAEYEQIRMMDENSRYIVLIVRHHAPVVFRKDEVLGGRADELKAFLVNKTGLEFRSFRG